jgi:AcrR family transcriptional regulator
METKHQILTKAESLFMRYGIKSVTMDDLAREMGMSKKTLYQYVSNKADLIENIFQLKIEEEQKMMAQYKQDSINAIDEVLKIARHVIRELRQFSPTVMYDLQKYYRATYRQMEAYHSRHIIKVIRENVERGIQEGIYRSNLSPDIVSKLYVAKSSLVADQELFPLQQYNIEQLFKEHIIYHIYGIASPKGLGIFEKYLKEKQGEIE